MDLDSPTLNKGKSVVFISSGDESVVVIAAEVVAEWIGIHVEEEGP